MSYIGAEPTTAAFPFDQFSGDGTTTAFTLTYAPASTTSIMVAISGVVQNPNLYSVVGTTLTFSPAPPTGTNNIAVLYLGLPVIGSSSPGNTAFLSSTDLTATASQTVFASAGSYTPGFVQVYRNGARLGNADFTATNGTTITLASAATAGDLVTIEYYTLTSLTNALPLTGGTVTGTVTIQGLTVGKGAGAVATNTALGTSALAANTTGANSVCLGYQAGLAATTGTYNTAVGSGAGRSSTTSGNNTLIGGDAGAALTGGSNTFIGAGVGQLITTGTKNTIIGSYNGNQGGLDIRTSSSNIVLSDGDGNPRLKMDSTGQLSSLIVGVGLFEDYGCRAWVNFNGTGTVAIRGSGNVSSITDNGTGDYTINFTTAMPDANYSVCVGNGSFNDGVNDNNIVIIGPRRATTNPYTTSGARINTAYRAVGSTSQFDDPAIATLAFFR